MALHGFPTPNWIKSSRMQICESLEFKPEASLDAHRTDVEIVMESIPRIGG